MPAGQHHPCDKGTGLTSIVESLNTKWRQHQSGLVRRSCGVHPKIGADLFERFRLLVDGHNRQSARQWQCRQNEAAAATQSNPQPSLGACDCCASVGREMVSKAAMVSGMERIKGQPFLTGGAP